MNDIFSILFQIFQGLCFGICFLISPALSAAEEVPEGYTVLRQTAPLRDARVIVLGNQHGEEGFGKNATNFKTDIPAIESLGLPGDTVFIEGLESGKNFPVGAPLVASHPEVRFAKGFVIMGWDNMGLTERVFQIRLQARQDYAQPKNEKEMEEAMALQLIYDELVITRRNRSLYQAVSDSINSGASRIFVTIGTRHLSSSELMNFFGNSNFSSVVLIRKGRAGQLSEPPEARKEKIFRSMEDEGASESIVRIKNMVENYLVKLEADPNLNTFPKKTTPMEKVAPKGACEASLAGLYLQSNKK